MEIAINAQSRMSLTKEMEEVICSVLNESAKLYGLPPDAEVGVLLTDNEYIRELNLKYRDKDYPTDVLSFALNEKNEEELSITGGPQNMLLGDIVISMEMAACQAAEYGHSFSRELAFLTVHGILHLLGYDHEKDTEKAEMRKEEEYILSSLGIDRN